MHPRHARSLWSVLTLTILLAGTTIRGQEPRQDDDRGPAAYRNDMRQAYEAWETNDTSRAQRLLQKHIPRRGEKDQRAWEWYHLHLLLTGRLFSFAAPGHEVVQVAWAPDGRTLAAVSRIGGSNHSLVLWDMRTGKEIRKILAPPGHQMGFCWSPDGKRLAWWTGAADRLRFWERDTDKEVAVHVLAPKQPPVARQPVVGRRAGWPGWAIVDPLVRVAWSPDGKHVASAARSGIVKLWDPGAGEQLASFLGGQVLAWAPDSRTLAVARWEPSMPIRTIAATAVALSASLPRLRSLSAATFVTAGNFKAISIWDVASKRTKRRLFTDTQALELAFSPDGKRLAEAAHNGSVALWDTSTGAERFRFHARSLYSPNWLQLIWSPDGRDLTWLSLWGIRVWRTSTGEELAGWTLIGVEHLAASRDGRRIAFRSDDGMLLVRDWQTKRDSFITSVAGHVAAWSADGKHLAVAADQHALGSAQVNVYDAAANRSEATRALAIGSKRAGSGDQSPLGFPVSWSPNGKELASLNYDGTATLWQADVGKELRTLGESRPSLDVNAFAWNPAGTRIATATQAGFVRIWDREGRLLRTFADMPPRPMNGSSDAKLLWSPDGSRLAFSISRELAADVRVWDERTGQGIFGAEERGAAASFNWSSDGRRLAISGAKLRIVDGTNGRELFLGDPQFSLAWSPAGTHLAAGGFFGAWLWDAATAKAQPISKSWAFAVAWSPDGRRLALIGDGLSVLDPASRKVLWSTPPGRGSDVRWSSDGSRLVSYWPSGMEVTQNRRGFSNGVRIYHDAIRIHDAANGKELLAAPAWTRQQRLEISADGKRVALEAAPFESANVRVFESASAKEIFHARMRAMSWISWTPDGKHLAWPDGVDPHVYVWDGTLGKASVRLDLRDPAFAPSWSPDGSRFAFGTAGLPQIFDVAAGKMLPGPGPVPGGGLTKFAWSPDGSRMLAVVSGRAFVWKVPSQSAVRLGGDPDKMDLQAVSWGAGGRIASGSRNGVVTIWDPNTGKTIADLPELQREAQEELSTASRGQPRLDEIRDASMVSAVAWSSDGRHVAAAARVGAIAIWDAATFKQVATWHVIPDTRSSGQRLHGAVLALAWSSDSKRLAAATPENVRIWDLAANKEVQSLSGQGAALAWEPGGWRLAIARGDQTVSVVNAATGEEAYAIREHRDPVFPQRWNISSVAWSPDGRRLATATDDSFNAIVRLWDAAGGEPLLTLRPPANRRLESPLKLAWSPDGRRLVAQTSGTGNSIVSATTLWEAAPAAAPGER